jgi:uncharacterized protein (TIGR02466 family)
MTPGTIETLFVTEIYRASLTGRGSRRLLDDLARTCRAIASDDAAGQTWSRAHGYAGYTSYASLDDLPWRAPDIAELVGHLDDHVAAFARMLEFELGDRALGLDSLWINVLAFGGMHGSHLHPHSVISGTLYVAVPEGASAIRFEDPRLAMMMAAPVRRAKAQTARRPFVSLQPKVGTLLLWESWLRHEVPLNAAAEERISISFNYALK